MALPRGIGHLFASGHFATLRFYQHDSAARRPITVMIIFEAFIASLLPDASCRFHLATPRRLF